MNIQLTKSSPSFFFFRTVLQLVLQTESSLYFVATTAVHSLALGLPTSTKYRHVVAEQCLLDMRMLILTAARIKLSRCHYWCVIFLMLPAVSKDTIANVLKYIYVLTSQEGGLRTHDGPLNLGCTAFRMILKNAAHLPSVS